MKKLIILFAAAFFTLSPVFSQSEDELFGSDDDLFFGEDEGIIDLEELNAASSSDTKSDLKHGVLFETGSVKIGGSFNMSLGTTTTFNDGETFRDSLWNTKLLPVADAGITVDARPSENLRMYMKTGIAYPYVTSGTAALYGQTVDISAFFPIAPADSYVSFLTSSDLSLRNMFYVKELFTDFNLGPNTSMRFGKQTVTWGTGYFYSPADVINSAIDPENPTKQVEGPLCLRAQIVFPGTQNALWAYIIPDADVSGSGTDARKTALAAKGEFVLEGWELGFGGYYKYNTTPRLMFTASGTLFRKLSVFAEATGCYGQPEQWASDKDKDFYSQATAGFMYTWKNPQITLMGQYYYNGQTDSVLESLQSYITAATGDASQASILDFQKRKGHNLALALNFGKIYSSKVSAALYAISNFTNETLIGSMSVNYSPFSDFSMSAGPYISWNGWENKPVPAVKLTFNLGGGKF